MGILIQFDGSNFYKKVKRVLPFIHLTNYVYREFATSLVSHNTEHINIIYYIGEVRQYSGNKKSEILFNNQQSLFLNLRKQNIHIKLGYLLMNNGIYHEKGVDVQIAVDIVRGAIKNEYDKCYLISSDTDLIPAIHTAKDEGKEIIYVGFENFISKAMKNNCSSSLILKKEDILKFAKQ